MSCIERLYRTRRTSLNVYAPDISNVYDSGDSERMTRQDPMTNYRRLLILQSIMGSRVNS
jgi:hypothetical protein